VGGGGGGCERRKWEEMFKRKERAEVQGGRRAKSRSVEQVKRRKGFMLRSGFRSG